MKVSRVCVGQPREVEYDGGQVSTSIFKTPVSGRVQVGLLNIAGDKQSDLSVHGGRDKAVYVYSEDYSEEWCRHLGVTALEASQFGENLTVTGCTDEEVVIGSRYRIGTVEVTVTQPRIPCFKLGIRLNDSSFPRTFWDRGHLGFYLRVEQEGMLAEDDDIELTYSPAHGITVRRLYESVTERHPDGARDALEQLPHLDEGWVRRLRRIAGSKKDSSANDAG